VTAVSRTGSIGLRCAWIAGRHGEGMRSFRLNHRPPSGDFGKTDRYCDYNRGNSRIETGDKDGAIADYRQAATLNPSMKQATEMLRVMGKAG